MSRPAKTPGGEVVPSGPPAQPLGVDNASAWDEASIHPHWLRRQAHLRFKVARFLAGLGLILVVAAGVTWSLGFGRAPDSTTTTVDEERGIEVSRTTVTTSSDPIRSLPIGLAIVGLGCLAPIISWSIAPGTKLTGPGGMSAEGLDLSAVETKTDVAVKGTAQEVNQMVQAVSPLAGDQEGVKPVPTKANSGKVPRFPVTSGLQRRRRKAKPEG
jgi:hypothetical protein